MFLVFLGEGAVWDKGSICTSHPAAPGSILCVSEKFSLGKINSRLQRYTDGPAKRLVAKSLIM